MPEIKEVSDVPEAPATHGIQFPEDEEDKMTPEEREAKDKAERAAEEAEQAKLPYKWTQGLPELVITVPVPPGTRARDVQVDIQKRKLSVGLKGKEPVMSGELYRDIKLDSCTWLIDGDSVQVHLEKVDQRMWWEHVLTHHPKIDISKCQPENSKLGDLDQETKAFVEKMMFDQEQKRLGKPTSDQLQNMQLLDKFKSQHPEMDFSNAKIQT